MGALTVAVGFVLKEYFMVTVFKPIQKWSEGLQVAHLLDLPRGNSVIEWVEAVFDSVAYGVVNLVPVVAMVVLCVWAMQAASILVSTHSDSAVKLHTS